MPVFRNVNQSQGRHSGRLENRVAVAYDNEGWEVPLGQNTLQNLCLARGNSPLYQSQPRPAPPSMESHPGSRPSDLDNDYPFTQETVALAWNGNSSDRRPRSDSAISASSSSSASSASSPPSTTLVTSSSKMHQVKPYACRSKGKSKKVDEEKVPRPRNAFIVFRSYYNKLPAPVQPIGVKTNQNEVSRAAGKVWKSMSEEEQEPYRREAMLEKEEHHRLYPNYHYAPNSKKSFSGRAGPAARRKARAIAAEYTDSEGEDNDSYDTQVAATAPAPARSLRPRSACHYSIPSPSPSVRSISPTPSGTHCASSPSPSVSGTQTDLEHGFVATEDIPELVLSPSAVPVEQKVVHPEFTFNMDFCIPALANDTDAVFGVKPHAAANTYNSFLYLGPDDFLLDLPIPAAPPSPILPLASPGEAEWGTMSFGIPGEMDFDQMLSSYHGGTAAFNSTASDNTGC